MCIVKRNTDHLLLASYFLLWITHFHSFEIVTEKYCSPNMLYANKELQQLIDAFSTRNNDSYSIIFNLLKCFKEWSVEHAQANTSKKQSRSDTSCTKYKFHKDFFDQPFPDQSNSILQVCKHRLNKDEKSTSALLQNVFNFWTVNDEHKIIVLRAIQDRPWRIGESPDKRLNWIHRHFPTESFCP